MKKYLEAGKAVTTHGIKGELKIYPWCDSAEVLCGLKKLYLDESGQRLVEIETAREHMNMALIKFKGFDGIDEARKLIDRVLYLDRADLNIAPGTHFVVDLIGLRVVDADDETKLYGSISDVTENGAHEIYHIELASGGVGLVPAVKEMVHSIDIEAGVVKIRPVKGLLGDED